MPDLLSGILLLSVHTYVLCSVTQLKIRPTLFRYGSSDMLHAVTITSKATVILISVTFVYFPEKGRTNPSLYATN